MNVVFSSSDLYAKCTGIAMYSLLVSNQDMKDLNIYLVITDMTIENQQRIKAMVENFHREIVFIEATEILAEASKELGLAEFKGGYNTYVRAMANRILPSNIEKALFVDSDLVFTGNIKGIDDIDMSDKVIAGVPEIMLMTTSVSYEDEELLDACNHYLNFGVVYINLENWRKYKGDDMIRNCVANAKHSFRIAEQSIVNLTFRNYSTTIPVKYNYYTILHENTYERLCRWYKRKKVFEKEDLLEAEQNPVIIHFVGDYFNRPWYQGNICRFKEVYMDFYLQSPWKEEPLDAVPRDISLPFKLYYTALIFLRKNYYDTAYFKFRYIMIQWIRERMPRIDKIKRKK